MALSTANVSAAAPGAASSIGLQDFVRVLTTQLTYQDPLKPMDNQAFMAQLAQFTTLGQTEQLNTNMGALLNTQATLQSVGLIGRTVDITQADSTTVTGTVQSLSLSGDTPTMTIQTSSGGTLSNVTMSQLVKVH